jgi:carboxymethylenebutenolidase
MIIQEETAEIPTATGSMRTYVYRPVTPGKYPGIVLFSEIFQQTGPIKRAAMMYAGHGFIVAVPEIFHELESPGTVLAYDQTGADRGNRDKVEKELSSYDADATACLQFLEASPHCSGQLGAIGICIGGHLAYRAAMNSKVTATACFYATDIHKGSLGRGLCDDSLARTVEIKGELLMIWGRQDPHIPAEGRAAIYARLTEVGANFTWHEFNGQHAFMRDEGARYDPELQLICYQLALSLFRRRFGCHSS